MLAKPVLFTFISKFKLNITIFVRNAIETKNDLILSLSKSLLEKIVNWNFKTQNTLRCTFRRIRIAVNKD